MSEQTNPFSYAPDRPLVFFPVGPLDISSVPRYRQEILSILKTTNCTGIAIEAERLTNIDGIGLGFLAELRSLALRLFKSDLIVTGIAPEFEHLVAASRLTNVPAQSGPRLGLFELIEHLGANVHGVAMDAGSFMTESGELMIDTVNVIRRPGHFRFREFFSLCVDVGVNALPIVSLLAFILGTIVAFQTSVPLDRFGALSEVPTIVALGICRELGPLIAAILVAGRSGAAFAAEIGTMRITEELSALRVMGLRPVAFLVVPRVLATMLMLPLLCVYTDIVGTLGGYVVMAAEGFSFSQYVESLRADLTISDALGGLVKTIVFALLIAFAGCHRGMTTGAGPGAVGRSTTSAVVSSIVLILVTDMVFGFLYYVLKI